MIGVLYEYYSGPVTPEGTASRFERRKLGKPNAVDRSGSSVALPGSLE